jgi:mono/diheme cytochrome c family protein
MSDTLPTAAPVEHPAEDAARPPVAAARPPRQPRARPRKGKPAQGEEASGPRAKRRPKDAGQDERRARAIEALALAALLTVAGQANAAPGPMRGSDLFACQCAICHGATATGEGPLALALTVRPTDRTGPERGGALPVFRILARINGREARVMQGLAPAGPGRVARGRAGDAACGERPAHLTPASRATP